MFIASGRGSLNKFKQGALTVVEEGLGDAESEGEYESLAIKRAYSLMKEMSRVRAKDQLEAKTLSHTIISNFIVMNYKTDELKEPVLRINNKGEVDAISDIVFPQNSTNSASKPKITVSANLGLHNYDGTSSFGHALVTCLLYTSDAADE